MRGIGEVTDIVEHEMYSFEDRSNHERLTLRPEFTAGTVRAAIEHSLTYDGPKRVWSMGPLFRHERPQRGRYRQFHQVNVEALGFAGPDIDAEQIVMLARLWKILGIDQRADWKSTVSARLTSVRAHRAELVAYLKQHHDELDADSRRRLATNPLRILDSKNPEMADSAGWCSADHCRFSATHRAAISKGCRHCSQRRMSGSQSTRAWCAASTTTT